MIQHFNVILNMIILSRTEESVELLCEVVIYPELILTTVNFDKKTQ